MSIMGMETVVHESRSFLEDSSSSSRSNPGPRNDWSLKLEERSVVEGGDGKVFGGCQIGFG